MPVIHGSNSRITPPNDRTVDVAKQAIRDIMPIQQKKYANAFAVQGFSTLVYNLLQAGRPCSCQARGAALAARMNKEGKLDNGDINKLITGGHEYRVLPYGVKRQNTLLWRQEEGEDDPHRKDTFDEVDKDGESMPPPFNKVGRSAEDPSVRDVQDGGFGANGPVQDQATIDDLDESAFEPESFGMNDVACAVCLGTGFIGAASVVGGWREILTPQDESMSSNGFINTLKKPLSLEKTTSARWTVTLPKGAWTLDALRVWNNNQIIPATILIDSIPVAGEHVFLQFCDGKPHTIDIVFAEPKEFTHVEIQAGVSETPFRIEFPRLSSSSDLQKLDQTEDVQLYASPELPMLRTKDLVVESTYGKVFQIVNGNRLNDNEQRMLGWEMMARVIQPLELYNLLPRRAVGKQKTTLPVRSNMSGGHKT